jgi:tetratricopeptide (TPR) repeat protein
VAQAFNALAVALIANQQYNKAEDPLLRALEIFRKQPQPECAKLAVALSNLGAIRRYQSRNAEAADLFREAIAVVDAQLGTAHPLLLRTLNNLALVETLLNHREAAESAFRRAITVTEERQMTSHPSYAMLLLNFAEFERKYGNKKAAKALETQAKAVFADSARSNGAGMTVDVSAFRAKR